MTDAPFNGVTMDDEGRLLIVVGDGAKGLLIELDPQLTALVAAKLDGYYEASVPDTPGLT
ncbi:MAG TPA: hypothetical protein VK923_20850 [Euzebyales bacterium]|nr:hypothetical protein [Euzebyales bacterium]